MAGITSWGPPLCELRFPRSGGQDLFPSTVSKLLPHIGCVLQWADSGRLTISSLSLQTCVAGDKWIVLNQSPTRPQETNL